MQAARMVHRVVGGCRPTLSLRSWPRSRKWRKTVVTSAMSVRVEQFDSHCTDFQEILTSEDFSEICIEDSSFI
jgi:hypothetical protein